MRQDVAYYCICISTRNNGEKSVPKFMYWKRYFH